MEIIIFYLKILRQVLSTLHGQIVFKACLQSIKYSFHWKVGSHIERCALFIWTDPNVTNRMQWKYCQVTSEAGSENAEKFLPSSLTMLVLGQTSQGSHKSEIGKSMYKHSDWQPSWVPADNQHQLSGKWVSQIGFIPQPSLQIMLQPSQHKRKTAQPSPSWIWLTKLWAKQNNFFRLPGLVMICSQLVTRTHGY